MANKQKKPAFKKVLTGGMGTKRNGDSVTFTERDITDGRKSKPSSKRKSA